MCHRCARSGFETGRRRRCAGIEFTAMMGDDGREYKVAQPRIPFLFTPSVVAASRATEAA